MAKLFVPNLQQLITYYLPQMWQTKVIGLFIYNIINQVRFKYQMNKSSNKQSHPPLQNENQLKSKNQQENCLLMRKINRIDNKRMQVSELAIDPHGQFVVIYQQNTRQFYVVQIITIYKYFLQFRQNYTNLARYQHAQSLPYLCKLQKTHLFDYISSLNISQRINHQQYIIVGYSDCLIEIIAFQRAQASLIKIRTFGIPNPIVNVALVNNAVYLSLYNFQLVRIDLTLLNQTQYEGQQLSYRIPVHLSSKHFITRTTGQEKKDWEFVRLIQQVDKKGGHSGIMHQTSNGRLIYNHQLLSNQYQQQTNFCDSFEEFLEHEDAQTFSPAKYFFSDCQFYLIGSSSGKIDRSQQFILRSGRCFWRAVVKLGCRPYINQYWSHHFSYRMGLDKEKSHRKTPSKYKDKQYVEVGKKEKIILCAYNSQLKQLIISKITINLPSKKRKLHLKSTQKQNKRYPQPQQYQQTRYAKQQVVLITIKNIKRDISTIKWVGLNQLMFVDDGASMYYVEFDIGMVGEE